MKIAKLHTGSVADICYNDTNLDEYIHSKINSVQCEDKNAPFFVCDLGNIVEKWKRFAKVLPRVQPFYAAKCNLDKEVMRLLSKLGANFDCVSKIELERVLELGVSPDRIIFGNPCKQTSFIKYAAAANVKLMTFDNEIELHKIKKHFPSAELLIRILVDQSFSKSGLKFGICTSETKKLLKKAKSLDLKVIGVSFHIGSGCNDPSLFYDAVRQAKVVFEEAREVGFQFDLLDVGGGFTGSNKAEVTFEEVATKLNKALDEFFPVKSKVKIIAEPGRYFVESAFTSVCKVISTRRIETDNVDAQPRYIYQLNDGVFGSFSRVLFDQQSPWAYYLKGRETGDQLYNCSLWGPTCDSMDCVTKSIFLPKINVGEWICFPDMGAYTIAVTSHFKCSNQQRIVYFCRQKFSNYLQKS